MKTNANDRVIPTVLVEKVMGQSSNHHGFPGWSASASPSYAVPIQENQRIDGGLTKREHFALEILKSIVSSDDHQNVYNFKRGPRDGQSEQAVAGAVHLADLLVDQLNKEVNSEPK